MRLPEMKRQFLLDSILNISQIVSVIFIDDTVDSRYLDCIYLE